MSAADLESSGAVQGAAVPTKPVVDDTVPRTITGTFGGIPAIPAAEDFQGSFHFRVPEVEDKSMRTVDRNIDQRSTPAVNTAKPAAAPAAANVQKPPLANPLSPSRPVVLGKTAAATENGTKAPSGVSDAASASLRCFDRAYSFMSADLAASTTTEHASCRLGFRFCVIRLPGAIDLRCRQMFRYCTVFQQSAVVLQEHS